MIFLYLAHDTVSMELLMVIYKDGGAGKPLPIQLAPYSFSPSRVGNGEMDGTLMQIVPVNTCGNMAQGIQMVMSHHLGFSARTTGKVHEQGVFIAVHVTGSLKLRCTCPFLHPVMESFRYQGANAYQGTYARTFRHGLLYLFQHISISASDDGFY